MNPPIIRTSRPITPRAVHDGPNTNTRFICRIVREVLKGRQSIDFADLKPEVRKRLKALSVGYRPADLDAAINVVATNADALRGSRLPVTTRTEPIKPYRELTRAEATARLQEFFDQVGKRFAVKTL